MSWATAIELSRRGVVFGAHAMTHPALTQLNDEELELELSASADAIESALGVRPKCFAPPYGLSDSRVQAAIKKHYRVSFGVRLGEAGRDSPRYDVPRIEMHYYRDAVTWRNFLEGHGGLYLRARQAMRGLKSVLTSSGKLAPG